MQTIEADRSDLREIETGMLATWPALETKRDGAWVLRAANGFTGRANSLTILDPNDGEDIAARLDRMEAFYSGRGLAPQVRVTGLTPAGVVSALHARGYRPADHTDILAGAIPDATPSPADVEIAALPYPEEEWFKTARDVYARPDGDPATVRACFRKMPEPVRFLIARCGGLATGIAIAAVHGTTMTVHNVATHPNHRRSGIGRAMMADAFRIGRATGATRLWISVVAHNGAAQGLYRGFDLGRVSGYHYLRLPR